MEQARVEIVHVKLNGWDTDLRLKFTPRDIRVPVTVFVATLDWWYEPVTGWWGNDYEVKGCTRAAGGEHETGPYPCRCGEAWWPPVAPPTGPPDLQANSWLVVVYRVVEGAKVYFHLKLDTNNIRNWDTTLVVEYKWWYQPETGLWGDTHEVQGFARACVSRQQR
jgi:hypothetical protein